MNVILANMISTIALIFEIAIYQFKGMKAIVIGQCVSNFLIVLNYALMGGMSGAAVCIVATVQTFVIYLFQRKEKSFPVSLTAIFMAFYLVCSVFTYKGLVDIIPTVAALIFALSVVQSQSWKYRIIILVNSLLWVVYDIATASYILIITHVIAVVSVLIGIIRLDIKRFLKKNN